MTGLKGRIPVEPLDDERLTNIERRIVASAAVTAPRRTPRFGVALAVATAALIAIGAGFAGWQLRGTGSATTHTTVVAAAPLRVNTAREHSTLDIGDARLTIDPATDFTVTRPDGGVLVAMTRGKIELDVAKRTRRPPLVVAAGDTRVTVIGTRFSVDYGDGTGEVVVRVFEGIVKVERHQHAVRLVANQAWTTKRGVVALGELPTVVAATRSEPIEIDVATPDVLDERTAKAPDVKPATTSRATKPDARVRVTPAQRGGGVAVDLRKQVLAVPLFAPIPTTEGPEKAIGAYTAIMREHRGVEHAHALYSMAWMQAIKLGRTADALRSIDAVTRGFQGRTEYRDIYRGALWLRVRILCTRGAIDDRCRQAAYTYMQQASGTPAAKVAEALTLAPR